jgi:hypothetical protein
MIHLACRLKGFVPLIYAIMPNHFHLLVCSESLAARAQERAHAVSLNQERMVRLRSVANQPGDSVSDLVPKALDGGLSRLPSDRLSKLMQSIKGTFSRTVEHGHVWRRGNYILYLDNGNDATRVATYIINNSKRAGLPTRFSRQPYVWINTKILLKLIK